MRRVICLTLCLIHGIGFLCSQNNILNVDEVFELITRMNGFQEVVYIEDDIKFPSNIGFPTMIIHGNADPREAIIDLINRLPKSSLVYDRTNEQGKFDRMFLDEKTNHLLYVHVGLGGNDTVLIIFRGGKEKDIQNFINKL